MNLANRRLLILVGLTGVGKTTTVQALEWSGLDFSRLPGRREITDQKIIGWLQDQDGESRRPVHDRAKRFDYTRRYRELFPGGMAHALASLGSELFLESRGGESWQLFDGLRGANEVGHAATLLPQAHFLVLLAPNAVRVSRLLVRGDEFDQMAKLPGAGEGSAGRVQEASELVKQHSEMLGDSERTEIERLVSYGQLGPTELAELEQKLRIVAKEHQNYSARETVEALLEQAPERTTVVRTDQQTPDQIADQLVADVTRGSKS